MLKLVDLLGCRYLGGRAETAPKLRTGESSRLTMADAGNEIGTTCGEAYIPFMPHLMHGEEELEEKFPRLEVPDEELLDNRIEQETDEQDHVFAHGMRIAREIEQDMTTHGRRRRPAMSPTPLDPVSGSPSERMSRSLKQTQEDRPGRGNTRYKASRQEGRRGKTCDSTSLSLISCRSLRTCSNTVICKATQQEALPSLVRSLGRRELRAVGTRGAATAPGGHGVPGSCTLPPGPAQGAPGATEH